MSTNPSESAKKAFQDALFVVRQEYKGVADGEQMLEKITAKLTETFDKPPREEFEQILRKRFSDDEVRIVVFRPNEEQVDYYPVLMSVLDEVPASHPAKKVQAIVITVVYLIHRKSQDFRENFILADGFDSIAHLMVTKNLYLRGQAMETFLSLTDCDSYDWFAAPVTSRQRDLHRKLLGLTQNQKFLDNVVFNRLDSYPGGSFRALQILAFWLSWVRALYAHDQKLQLSQKLLECLSMWCTKKDVDLSEEEIQLAKTLYDDFGKQQLASIPEEDNCKFDKKIEFTNAVTGFNKSLLSESHVEKLSLLKAHEELNLSEIHASLQEETSKSPTELMKSLKEKGNLLFKSNDYEDCLNAYNEAIVIGVEALPETKETNSVLELLLQLYTNKANTLWKIAMTSYEAAANSNLDIDSAAKFVKNLVDARSACTAACDIDNNHVKAIYRQANIMIILLDAESAVEMLDKAISELITSKKSNIDDLSLLKKLRSQCLASIYERKGITFVEQYLSPVALHCFTALRTRTQPNDYRHPWNDAIVSILSTQKTFSDRNADKNGCTNEKKKRKVNQKKDLNGDTISKLLSAPPKPQMIETTKTKSGAVVRRNHTLALEAFTRLKRIAEEYNRSDAGKGETLDSFFNQARQEISLIWKQKLTLKEVFSCTLEENHVKLLLMTAHYTILNESDGKSRKTAWKILKETLDCERIATVLKLALIGQDEFKKDLTELSSQIQPIKEYLCREAKVDDKKFEIVLEKLTQILS